MEVPSSGLQDHQVPKLQANRVGQPAWLKLPLRREIQISQQLAVMRAGAQMPQLMSCHSVLIQHECTGICRDVEAPSYAKLRLMQL